MICPECNKPLKWLNDELIEDEQPNYIETMLICNKCDIEVFKTTYINN